MPIIKILGEYTEDLFDIVSDKDFSAVIQKVQTIKRVTNLTLSKLKASAL